MSDSIRSERSANRSSHFIFCETRRTRATDDRTGPATMPTTDRRGPDAQGACTLLARLGTCLALGSWAPSYESRPYSLVPECLRHLASPEAQHTTHESAQCTRMPDHAVIETRAARPKIDIQNGLSLISYNGSVGDSSAYVTLL